MSSTTANSAEKVKQGEGSDSVHGFGYCFRDRRHVPAATTQPHHDLSSMTTSFQRNGSKADDPSMTNSIHFPVELVHEGDASFLTGHLLLTRHTLLGTVFVIGSLHKLSSVMMHGRDASFLVGHLLVASIVSP